MEDQDQQACKPLPIESFSHSWLVNFPAFEDIENSTRTSVDTYDDLSSFIEMDPKLPPSRRFFISPKDRSFKFDNFLNSECLAHADELFCDGYVMPLFANSAEESQPLDHSSVRPRSNGLTKSKSSSCSRGYRGVSKWVLLKYVDFLTPLYRRIRSFKSSRSSGSNNGTKGGYDTRIRASRNRVYSDETTTSPRISVAEDWRRSCDSESSIYEAVLHCKKSFGK